MERIAIIGAGISGLSTAQLLKDSYSVTVFEKESSPGGLIRCRRVNGSLFHICGGHVFNSKRQEVLDWFWPKFARKDEFSMTDRNACVFMDKNLIIPYPIEDHVYYFDTNTQKLIYQDFEEIERIKGNDAGYSEYDSFGDFLFWRFGKTLYNLYFQPYNQKLWRRDLSRVPMSWMAGKLPMPTIQEMRNNNANKIEEKSFVHSQFWYENINGSQYIADRLAKGLNIKYNSEINSIKRIGDKWYVCGGEEFDKVIFCGNIKDMVRFIDGVDLSAYECQIENLAYHGTTSVFCEIDTNPYSWIYLPSCRYKSHRIICTGNFAPTNNDISVTSKGRITATVEFTDAISKDDILFNLRKMPLNPQYIEHEYNKYSYPIQDQKTREMVKKLKANLALNHFYFTGRFADWEYYNMDVAIAASMNLCSALL